MNETRRKKRIAYRIILCEYCLHTDRLSSLNCQGKEHTYESLWKIIINVLRGVESTHRHRVASALDYRMIHCQIYSHCETVNMRNVLVTALIRYHVPSIIPFSLYLASTTYSYCTLIYNTSLYLNATMNMSFGLAIVSILFQSLRISTYYI